MVLHLEIFHQSFLESYRRAPPFLEKVTKESAEIPFSFFRPNKMRLRDKAIKSFYNQKFLIKFCQVLLNPLPSMKRCRLQNLSSSD